MQAIEVRVGPGGVKAKWVRIELRKVETLPGGGLANTFFDFVGQSPVNLWQSGEEYALLSTVRSHTLRMHYCMLKTDWRCSKTFHSPFVFRSRYLRVLHLRKAVRTP